MALAAGSGARTRVERNFDPVMVRRLKSATELFQVPVIVGGGKRALPDGVRSDLELLDTQEVRAMPSAAPPRPGRLAGARGTHPVAWLV